MAGRMANAALPNAERALFRHGHRDVAPAESSAVTFQSLISTSLVDEGDETRALGLPGLRVAQKRHAGPTMRAAVGEEIVHLGLVGAVRKVL